MTRAKWSIHIFLELEEFSVHFTLKYNHTINIFSVRDWKPLLLKNCRRVPKISMYKISLSIKNVQQKAVMKYALFTVVPFLLKPRYNSLFMSTIKKKKFNKILKNVKNNHFIADKSESKFETRKTKLKY